MYSGRISRLLHTGYKVAGRQTTCAAVFARKPSEHDFSTSARVSIVMKSPYPDVEIPEDVNLAHYVSNEFPKHGNRVAFVSISPPYLFSFICMLHVL